MHISPAGISLDFVAASKTRGVSGAELPGKVNYIHGSDPRQWLLGLPSYASVRYREIYSGIDVVYRSEGGSPEFDLVLKPQADPNRIRLRFNGAQKISVNADGGLRLHSAAEDLRLPLPAIYQEVDGAKRVIKGRYVLQSGFDVAFQLDAYDRTQSLVIDPEIVYTYLLGGGTGASSAYAVAADSQTNVYVAGITTATDFPQVNAAYPPDGNSYGDGFISKLDSSGTTLLYSTYVDGISGGTFTSLAIDSTGNAWVTGRAFGLSFPVLNGTQATSLNLGPYGIAIVMKLSPTGVPLYSGYLGAGTSGTGIALDPNGNAYISCNYNGATTQYPATAGAYLSSTASADSWVAKLDPNGAIVYDTYFYGTANAIAVDATGSVYITGNIANLPNAPASGAQSSYAGGGDAYVAKFNPSGTALSYFTYLGGSGWDTGNAIAVDGNGIAYVGGSTSSSDFPVTSGAFQTKLSGASDGFVASLDSTGSAFRYVTYLGGSRVESVAGLAIDSKGNAYVTGTTDSSQFPTASPIDGALSGNSTSLYRTTDGGNTWSPLDGMIPGAVVTFSPDPRTPGLFVASTESGVYRSTDYGNSWTLTSPYANTFLSRSPADPSVIFQMLYPNYVQRSADGGMTWSPYASAFSGAFTQILADATNSTAAYAYAPGNSTIMRLFGYGQNSFTVPCTLDGLVMASDGTWYADLYNPFPSPQCGVDKVGKILTGAPMYTTFVSNPLALSTSNPSVLYKSNGAGPGYVTNDAGATWSPTGTPPAPLGTLAVSPTNPSMIYAAATAGPVALYTSRDGGQTWSPSAGLGVAAITQIVVSPSNSSEAYALAPLTSAAYVTEINSTGTALIYSTYLGSAGLQGANSIALSDDVFIAGYGFVPFRPNKTISGRPAIVARISSSSPECTFQITPASQIVYAVAATQMYDVVTPSGCSWTAATDQPWATVVQSSSGTGSSVVAVGLLANHTSAVRTANLTIGGQSIPITQAPSSCTYSISPSTLAVGPAGGVAQTTLTTGNGCPWSVVNTEPFAISITQGASGVGSGVITLQVASSPVKVRRYLSVSAANTIIPIFQADACEPTLDQFPSALDVQQIIQEALGLAAPSNDINADGSLNLVDAQIVVNGSRVGICAAN